MTSRRAFLTILGGAAFGLNGLAKAAPALDLTSLRGRVVYLDFWASWCAPCRQSFPWMQALEDTYRRKGLDVIAVDVDHEHADAARFLTAYPSTFRIVFDPGGALAQQFDVVGMPTSILLDRQGRIRFRHVGFQPQQRDAYEQQVQQLLAEH